jgi:hypothetical protein
VYSLDRPFLGFGNLIRRVTLSRNLPLFREGEVDRFRVSSAISSVTPPPSSLPKCSILC